MPDFILVYMPVVAVYSNAWEGKKVSNLYEQFYFPSLCVFVSIIHLACASPIFISLCATHIVPRPLFCSGYFYSTACTYDTNFAFPIPLHIPCFPFLAMIVVSIFPLNSTPPFFLILFPFSILFLLWFHSPPTVLIFPFCSIFLWSYLYHLFAFSLFHFYVPTNQCRLTYVNFALSVPFLSLLYLLPLAAFPLDCEQSLFCSRICKQEYLSSKVTCSLPFFFFLSPIFSP